MKKLALVLGSLLLAATSNAAQAAKIVDSYNVQAFKGTELVLSGSFSVLHDDPATVSVYSQTASLQSANIKLGSTTFTTANAGLFKNTSPRSYSDTDLYQLYGVGTGTAAGTGVGGATDDFSLTFNPYTGGVANLLYARANPAIGGTFADRVVLTAAVTGAVPEPATWGMMIVGFGLTGAAMRRRVRVTKLQTA